MRRFESIREATGRKKKCSTASETAFVWSKMIFTLRRNAAVSDWRDIGVRLRAQYAFARVFI